MMNGIGLPPSAVPTARTARSFPIRSATHPYGRTSPNGIVRVTSRTARWNGASAARSTGTVKKLRSPATYSASCSCAAPAHARARAVGPSTAPRPSRMRAMPSADARTSNRGATSPVFVRTRTARSTWAASPAGGSSGSSAWRSAVSSRSMVVILRLPSDAGA
jgi:hypothetical protein